MSNHRTIEATGLGVVRAQAEVAILHLGASTEAEKPAEAVANNAAQMAKVIAAIKAQKIPESAIQTAGLQLQPILKWDASENQQILLGYRAENHIMVHTPVNRAGEVYDAGVVAGANRAGGIRFTVQDDKKQRREALALATKYAIDEIHTIAKVLGSPPLGPLEAQVIQESGPRPYELELDKAGGGETPIMPGRLEISARVRVVYALKHP